MPEPRDYIENDNRHRCGAEQHLYGVYGVAADSLCVFFERAFLCLVVSPWETVLKLKGYKLKVRN